MLQTINRLKKVRDFNLIMKHGKWVGGSFLQAKYVKLAKIQEFFPKREDSKEFEKQLRIGFSVGLKVSKSAVKRNRLKRQLREVVRLLIKEDSLENGYYVLIIGKKEALEKDYAEISEEIEGLLRKSHVTHIT
ncbi:MAG: ribonuclease P protein component [Parcubacteria group bacterium]|nr:ribonuclease P protein component [Parcubacteria group bacterium]